MRALPIEEGAEDKQSYSPNKKHPRVVEPNFDEIKHLTKRLNRYASDEKASDQDALKLIEDTRGTILKLRLIKQKDPKRNGKNNKKRPPKYRLH